MKKIVFVTTTTYAIDMFLLNSIASLAKDHNITIVTNVNDANYYEKIGAKTQKIQISRKPSLFKDIFILINLILVLLKIRPDVVHTMTPKGGLIGVLAARITRVKKIMHTYTGQVWVNKTGLSRKFYILCDSIILKACHKAYCDSKEQAKFLNDKLFFTTEKKINVIGAGSLGGVDLHRYKKSSHIHKKDDSITYCYLARKTTEKGANDCLKIFKEIHEYDPNSKLLFLGPEEENLTHESNEVLQALSGSILNINEHVSDLDYLNLSDVLLLPSYREGFGSIVIKAAACGVPTVAYDIYGTQSSVNTTVGKLVEVGNIHAFARAALAVSHDYRMHKSHSDQILFEHAKRYSETDFIKDWKRIHENH